MTHSVNQQRIQRDSRVSRIIEHVLRHRISTNRAIRLHVCTGLTPNAVNKLTARLCRSGLLARHPLFPPSIYFTLGPQAAVERGLPLRCTLPLGPQALPIEYGVLAYAALGSLHHRRLTSDELTQLLPAAPRALIDAPFAMDEQTSPGVLELIRIDLGGRADHVSRKCAADLRLRQTEPAFQSWLKQRRLRLVIVTGAIEKAATIRAAVDRHLWPDGLSIHLAVVPELLRLTGRI